MVTLADLNDDGRFSPGDLFLRIAVAAGDTATSLAPGDFLAAFAGLVGGPGNDVFKDEVIRTMMVNILFIYCKEHQSLSYRQVSYCL
jgi:hypothetical protein